MNMWEEHVHVHVFFWQVYVFFVSRNTNQMMEARKRPRSGRTDAKSGESP